jgi:hypothetical protein
LPPSVKRVKGQIRRIPGAVHLRGGSLAGKDECRAMKREEVKAAHDGLQECKPGMLKTRQERISRKSPVKSSSENGTPS